MRELTPLQREYVIQLGQGKSFLAVAQTMNVAEATVRNTIFRLYKRYDVHSTLQLIVSLLGQKIIYIEELYNGKPSEPN